MFQQKEGSKGYFKSRDSHVRKLVCTDQTLIPWAPFWDRDSRLGRENNKKGAGPDKGIVVNTGTSATA